ncbi:MAG: cupin domain-containing protein, partial [Alphaproteobacteria bacterium]
MAVEFMDLLGEPELEIGHAKKVLFSSDHFHTWIHGDYPGTKGPMHSHTADQIFYCVQGQCTFHFHDRDSQAINPGQMVLIPKGHHYQLDNTG